MYKTLLLLLSSVMVLPEGRASSNVRECELKTTFIYNCQVYTATSLDRNQKCRAAINLSPMSSFYFKTGPNFGFMELALSTRPSVPATILKIENYMFGEDVLAWHYTELKEEKRANGYTYSVYVDSLSKRTNSSTYECTNVTVYFKGFPSYALDCDPDSYELLSESFPPILPATQPSTQPPIENSTIYDAVSQDGEEKFSLVFIISVSGGMAGAVLLVIIAAQCYIFHKRLRSKGGEAQDAQENETEVISFHNSRQLPLPPNPLNPDPMEDDPEKHIYWEVSDMGPVTSVGGGSDDRRVSGHESINSIYATLEYHMEDDQ